MYQFIAFKVVRMSERVNVPLNRAAEVISSKAKMFSEHLYQVKFVGALALGVVSSKLK